MSRFPALGFDPAPGDPEELARLSRDTARAAREVDALADELRRLTTLDDWWCGVAADSLTIALGRLPQQLEVAHESFGTVASRLSDWVATLGDLQAQARAAEQDAAEALARLRAAQASAPTGLPPTSGGPEAFMAHLQAVRASARAVDAAERALAAARARGEAVQERARAGASRVEHAVRDAARAAPPEPGWLERVGESIVDDVRRLNAQAAALVHTYHKQIAAFTDLVSTAAFVAGFIPGVGAPLLLVLGGVALAGNGVLAAYTDERDLADVGLAATSFGLAGAAAAAGRAAKAARAVETGAPVEKLPSMFTKGLSMGDRELVWRTMQLQPTLAGHAVGLVSTVGTARDRGLLPPGRGQVATPGARRGAQRRAGPVGRAAGAGRPLRRPGARPVTTATASPVGLDLPGGFVVVDAADASLVEVTEVPEALTEWYDEVRTERERAGALLVAVQAEHAVADELTAVGLVVHLLPLDPLPEQVVVQALRACALARTSTAGEVAVLELPLGPAVAAADLVRRGDREAAVATVQLPLPQLGHVVTLTLSTPARDRLPALAALSAAVAARLHTVDAAQDQDRRAREAR